MDEHPGTLLASGRDADVFDLGDGTVLRRSRTGLDVEREAAAMRWLATQGISVPAVHRAEGADLVMDRVEGPTMLEDLDRRPWKLPAHARLLADLQRSLAELTAPDWLACLRDVPPGAAVLHLDLHPMNVMLSADGPVVIDWTNVSSGDADFDAANSYVTMAAFEAVGLKQRAGRRILVGAFVARRGRSSVHRLIPEACTRRLTDPNMTPVERVALDRIRTRALART